MDITLFATKYYFDKPGNAEIVSFAECLVADGCEYDALLEMAYSFDSILDVNEKILELYKQSDNKFPSHYEAGMGLARYYSGMIINSHCSPYEGAKRFGIM